MAPSGAGRLLAVLWLLVVRTLADPDYHVSAPGGQACLSIDSNLDRALRASSAGPPATIVSLADGCNTLTQNQVCTPITASLIVDGVSTGGSVWDTRFDVFQFAVAAGVNLTLRNLQLTRSLVFMSAAATSGYSNLQPALFYIRPGGLLLMQNVTIQTLCSSLIYWAQAEFAIPKPNASDAGGHNPIHVADLATGPLRLQNVTLTCDASVAVPSPLHLSVHTAPMLTAFAAAASALSLSATIHLMENITLPFVSGSYNTGSSYDSRVGLITSNMVITTDPAADANGTVTFVDANYTASWFLVQPPARLTLRGLVLTRLRSSIWAAVMNGVMAGALPVDMIRSSAESSSSPLQPFRDFEDSTLLVPQYEVTQASYWCKMLLVMAPEFASVADFLRSLIWVSECDVLDARRVMLARLRSTNGQYTRVQVTSASPPGVPFDPNTPPPNIALSYEHVQPPLYLVSKGAEWADALAPVLPADTWTSPPPGSGGGGAVAPPAPGSSTRSTSGGSARLAAAPLPALILLNGTVKLRPADFRVPGGGRRVVRRNAVISSMRGGYCSSGDPACPPPAVLDMGSLVDAIRLDEGVSILFQGITMRNVATTPTTNDTLALNLRSLFVFDRSKVRIIYDTVTLEMDADAFRGFYKFLTSTSRPDLPGGIEVKVMNNSYISLASFKFNGVRGTNVVFRLVPGLAPPSTSGDATTLDGTSTSTGSGNGSSSPDPAVIAGVVAGALLLALLLGLWIAWRRARRRTAGVDEEQRAKADQAAASEAAAADSSDDDVSGGQTGAAAAAPSAPDSAAGGSKADGNQLACHRTGLVVDEDMTGTTSAVTSASDAMTLQHLGGPGLLSAATMPVSMAGASGPMPRRVFSPARSVPEDDPLDPGDEEIARPCSSGREEQEQEQASGGSGSGHSNSGGGTVGLLLDPPTGMSSGEAGRQAANGVLLDPPAPSSTSVGPVVLAAAAVAATAGSAPNGGNASGSGSGSGHGPQRSSAGCVTHSSCTSGSSRRGSRVLLSGTRPHVLLLGDVGSRGSNLRVRALGRSPTRPSRSATSSSCCGPPVTLPAPAPAVLPSVELTQCANLSLPLQRQPQQRPPPQSGGNACASGVTSGTTSRLRSDRMPYLGSPPSGGGARERSQPAMMGGPELSDGARSTGVQSVQLTTTAGTLEPQSHNFDPDSSMSPGGSRSISKMPEPASEVQRLIMEMCGPGTDQLVILEPIGQGGYGTVYRGVWRNLDVAVKTVLFQDRANLTPAPTPAPGTTSLSHSHTIWTSVIEEGEEQDAQTRPPSIASTPHPGASPFASVPGAAGGDAATPPASGNAGTHNWLLASQQANISGSLPTVNMMAAVPPAGGPLGVASQQRAVLEAAVSCSVAHPNVVATYHYDITPVRPSGVLCTGGLLVSDCNRGPSTGPGTVSDWKLYLVQEFCDGGSLAAALDSRVFHDQAGIPNLALTLCALADITRGMAHIHSRSIVHGDLNPTNILLRTIGASNGGIVPMWNRVGGANTHHSGIGSGGGGSSGAATPGGGGQGSVSAAATLRSELGVTMVAKVADFGLCGMLAPGKRHISNAMRGTPFYTAPETVATGTLTKASDVYSFGVITWEVYTGRPPFQHTPEQGFVRDPNFPRLPPHVPPTLTNMMLACLQSDPDARPTFEQILDRLMALQSKLAASLQQRLSRLVASSGAILPGGALSPPVSTPLVNQSPHSSLTMTGPLAASTAAALAAALLPSFPPRLPPMVALPGPMGSGGSVTGAGSGIGASGGGSSGVAPGVRLLANPYLGPSATVLPPGMMAPYLPTGGSLAMPSSSSSMSLMGLPNCVAFTNSALNVPPMGSPGPADGQAPPSAFVTQP